MSEWDDFRGATVNTATLGKSLSELPDPSIAHVRPVVVCLCGSTRFKTDFESANREATMMGAIVLAPGVFGHADGILISEAQKTALDALHLRKIDMADVVWLIAPGGYVGESTRREIEYAIRVGKPAIQWANNSITYLPSRAGSCERNQSER